MKIIRLFREFYKPAAGTTALKNENDLVCFLGSLFMIIGSVASFLSLHLTFSKDISEIWFSMAVMAAMGILIFFIPSIPINEIIKAYIASVIFSVYLVFVTAQYFAYIGPSVWTISIIIIALSLLYSNKRMLLIVLTTTILVTIYFAYYNVEFSNWNAFYQAEIITLLIFSAIIIAIQKINRQRAATIHKQLIEIMRAEEKLRLTLESVGDGVITLDERGIIERMNPIAQKLTGWYNDEAIGQSIDTVFDIVNEYTREKTEDPVKMVFNTGEIVQLANHTLLLSRDGTEISIEDTAAPIKEKTGEIIGCVLVFRDSSEKKEKQRQIEYLSYHDQLTGLYNRRYFEEELKRLDTKRNLPLTIVYADVNSLKIINDTLGHDQGDKLIQLVAESFRSTCRADDIIARVGGDEFMILLPKTDKLTTGRLIERIKAKTEQMDIMSIKISVSFGWDTKDDENCPVENVVKNAEEIMYQNKILSSSKRNEIVSDILNTLFTKCPREESHSANVSKLCEDVGMAYHLGNDKIIVLSTLGKLHDIGKIGIDDIILNSANKLSHSEMAQIRNHPEVGYRLLGSTSEFNAFANDVLVHHERWDGTGYPNGLKGDAISWNARVLSIADSYDAMVSERPYKACLSQKEAIAEIRRNAGTQFDPEIAAVFIDKVLGNLS